MGRPDGSRASLRFILGALAVAVLIMVPAGAHAAGPDPSISRADAVALARAATTDDSALRELRAVTAIDGRPVDLAAVTAGLGSSRAERLERLAVGLSTGASGPAGESDRRDQARRSAREVLADGKYQERDVPKPFRGLLESVADGLRPIGRFLAWAFGPVLDLPGGPAILGAVLVGVGAAATALLISLRSQAAIARGASGRLVDPSLDPSEVERQADAAEGQGDRAGAVRLRYEAGLLRLVRADRLVLRADTTARGAARQIELPVMDQLTADFEEIVYGGRTATSADSDRSREGWAEVLGTRSRR